MFILTQLTKMVNMGQIVLAKLQLVVIVIVIMLVYGTISVNSEHASTAAGS